MIAAQVISIVAFLVSWTWWVSFLIGLGTMISLQIIWCCRQSKCGAFASSGVAAFAGVTSFIAGIVMLVRWKDKRYCEVFTFDGSGTRDDDYEYYDDSYRNRDYCREGAWSVVAFVTGIMWFAVSGCIFYFVKSGRHAKWEAKYICENNNSEEEGTAAAAATAIEMGDVSATTATIPTMGEYLPPNAVAAATATVTVLPETPNKVDNVNV